MEPGDDEANGGEPEPTADTTPTARPPKPPFRFPRKSDFRLPQNRRWRRTMIVSLLAAVGGGLLIGDYLLPDCEHEGCPAVERLESYRPPEPPQIFDIEGALAGQLSGPRRTVIGFDSIPEIVRDGYIAVEDRRFRDHGGVDVTGALRAFVKNIGSGGVEEGASTITMQLARNVFGEEVMDYNRWHRKATEIRTSRELEEQLTKDQILAMYLNQIYLGDGVWGVETASRHYFGKAVFEVSLAQAAVLIGLAKNPEGYNPRRNPERSRERRDLVLDILMADGMITTAEAAAAKQEPIETIDDPEHNDWGLDAYYVSAVSRELRELFPNPNDRSGMRVYTGLDTEAQREAATALVAQIRAVESGTLGAFRHEGAPADSLPRATGDSPYLQGMVVAMDVQTGLVSTVVGGRDYDHSEFDRAFQARRQPGSAFKPIVYLTAIASGLRPSETIPTDPIRLAQQGSEDWEPGDHVSASELSVRDALVYSSNTATVRIGQRAGIDRVVDQAHSMGISGDLPRYPSVFLGAGDVIPAELVAAYATFGNGGFTITPHFVMRIEDAKGRVLYQREAAASTRAVDPSLGFLVLDMMRDVVRRGTGTRASIPGVPVAGKTGTTNDAKDLWFIGLTPKRVAGVWIGFDRPATVLRDAGGGSMAAPVWARFMTVATRNDKGVGDWSPPPGVVQSTVDSKTGYLWGPGCTGTQRTEYFLAGTEPMSECPSYGPGWVVNALGEWEYQGLAFDSVRYSAGAGYSPYGSPYADTLSRRTIFFRDTATDDPDDFERRRRAQLDSMDRENARRRGETAIPTPADTIRVPATEPIPVPPPEPTMPAPTSPAPIDTLGAGR